MARDEVTVVIPTIPPRKQLLLRAIQSVSDQTFAASALSIAQDIRREGAAATRTRALAMARTKWVAFLDDDDFFNSNHLEVLVNAARRTGADYVFSWFMDTHEDPLGNFGKPYDVENPTQTTVTTLVRTDLAQEVGFKIFQDGESEIAGQHAGEDWFFTLGCIAKGARVVHVPERTWHWTWHRGNTSGMPNRW